MIERILEAFFRHWLLIILPSFVIPLVVMAGVLATPPQYEAQAGMWVEQATYLNYSTDDINRYLPPATNQKNRLAELMQTRSFLLEIANGTSLASIITGPTGDDELRQVFARDFDVVASGDHLLNLRFRAERRDDAVAVLDKMVTAFKARAAADRYGQAQVAISFYESRVSSTEAELSTARNGLAKYIADNPAVARALAAPASDPARFDPTYAEAQRRVDTAQKDADAARSSLDRAELDVAAGVQGLELGFRIVDPVLPSASPSRQIRKVLIYPIAALLLGVILSASLLFLFALSDRSVRSLADLGPDVVILGVLPRLRPRGVARRSDAAVTRRAVGFLAGAVVTLRPGRERKAS